MTTLLAEILDNHVLVICGTIALVVIVSEIGSYTLRWRKAELDAELKHEMLARGMTADQIVQVLQASSGSKLRKNQEVDRTMDYVPRGES